jgi:hypothetical protein
MAEMIQFHCPACGALLRLPLTLAAQQGPCPCCGKIIVAPDPYRGVGAYQPEPQPSIRTERPTLPFAESPSPLPKAPPVQVPVIAADHVNSPVPPPVSLHAPASQRAVLVLSILLTATVSLVAGYILGARANWVVSNTPFPVMLPPKVEAAPPVSPPVQTVLIKPQPVETKPAPTKASAAAQSALKAFLDAPDWTTRSPYVLHPEKVREAMEAYSHKVPDGATPYKSISIQNSYTDKRSGNTMFIFKVITEQYPEGIPVAVMETATGWQVDWQTFIEFRDDQFKTFADGPVNQTGRFHLIVSSAPVGTANEHFATFLLDPPYPGRQQAAYVKKSSDILATLKAATANGALITPVLEVTKHSTSDGKSYLEIVRIIDIDWLPEGGF